MALTPGTRLGAYEITAQIGVGGMGEVWCATDTNLGRQVAIKILPDAFAQDPDRLARFEREAKTLRLKAPEASQTGMTPMSSPLAKRSFKYLQATLEQFCEFAAELGGEDMNSKEIGTEPTP